MDGICQCFSGDTFLVLVQALEIGFRFEKSLVGVSFHQLLDILLSFVENLTSDPVLEIVFDVVP